MKQDKLIMEYDEFKISEEEIKYRKENKEDFGYEDLTDEEIEKMVYEDIDLFTFAWEDLKEYLTEVMSNLNKRNYYKHKWKVNVNNFGWRNLDGFKEVNAERGEELLREVLPNCDCTFRIFKDGKNGIKIQNFHHDSPMGNEWYYIKPMSKKEVEMEVY
jgi:hypothetical protein